MLSLQLKLICGIVGFGTLGTAITLPVLITKWKGAPPAVRKTNSTPKYWYKRNCYSNFLFERDKGEVVVCTNDQDTSLDFYLWWIEDIHKARFFEITSLKLETDSQISFTFKNSNSKHIDKKLKISSNTQNLSNLSDISLQESCQINGNDLSCNSDKYKITPQKGDFYHIWDSAGLP